MFWILHPYFLWPGNWSSTRSSIENWAKLRTFIVPNRPDRPNRPNRPESPGVCIYMTTKDSIGQFSRMYSAMRNKSGYNKIDSSINVKSKRMKLPSDNPPRILTLDGSPLIFIRFKIVSQSPRLFWISKFLTDKFFPSPRTHSSSNCPGPFYLWRLFC